MLGVNSLFSEQTSKIQNIRASFTDLQQAYSLSVTNSTFVQRLYIASRRYVTRAMSLPLESVFVSDHFTQVHCDCQDSGYEGSFCEIKSNYCSNYTCIMSCNETATNPSKPCQPCPVGFVEENWHNVQTCEGKVQTFFSFHLVLVVSLNNVTILLW